jgi:hypothetical protein
MTRFFSDPLRSLLRTRERYGTLSAIQQGDASMVFAFSPEPTIFMTSGPKHA